MILTDYLQCTPGIQWDYARQCGVRYAVIRLPETPDFDCTNAAHWDAVCKRFEDYGLHPLLVEPLPNALHDPIKAGDAQRDACIEKAVAMFPHMARHGIRTLCLNFMAYTGWTRTRSDIAERGGALVTGFDLRDYRPTTDAQITQRELWANYTTFIRAAAPEAERWGIRLALHPDDPPVERLGKVERIFTSGANMARALDIAHSPNVGLTLCQATFAMMGEDLYRLIPDFADRIFYVHFRNVRGEKEHFRETFHDNGQLDMAALLRLYRRCGVDVPIRVDHVPTMAGETNDSPGYCALGRLFAIGYLKGLMDALEEESGPAVVNEKSE